MPVDGMVQYDCNVSLRENSFGPSATVIVELPDGMEKHPKALEDHLFKRVLQRLKVVVCERSVSQEYSMQYPFQLQIGTDRGYHLGSLKMTAPHAPGWGWRDGIQVNLMENYFPTPFERYIEQALYHHLVIRVNQRTPPLPRTVRDDEPIVMQTFSGSPVPPSIFMEMEQDRKLEETYLHDLAVFASADAEPTKDSIAEVLRKVPQDVSVRTHTQGRDVALRGDRLLSGVDVAYRGKELAL